MKTSKPTPRPDLMNADEFRAQMARLDKKYKDLPHGDDTIAKLRNGYTNITLELMIEIGARLGIEPQVTWVPIQAKS